MNRFKQAVLMAAALAGGSCGVCQAQEGAAGEPPRIVSTSPAVGAAEVSPETKEITVTFDCDMAGGFSWTGGGTNCPPIAEGQRPFWRDARTAVYPVQLQPGRYYRIGVNSKSRRNFKSAAGVPALPSSIYFTTKGAGSEETDKMAKPGVVAMVPPNGAQSVDPQTSELRVTFSVPMGGGFSWTGGGDAYPQVKEGARPFWTEDGRTCVLPVKLVPEHAYRLRLNSPSHKNFKSASGVPLDPVVYTFKTGK